MKKEPREHSLYNNVSTSKKCCKFMARRGFYPELLKRVSDMRLNGSLDSEEPGTGSERSVSSGHGLNWWSKRRFRGSSSQEETSCSGSICEDESCASSVGESDCYPPYEEISLCSRNCTECSELKTRSSSEEKNYANSSDTFSSSFHHVDRAFRQRCDSVGAERHTVAVRQRSSPLKTNNDATTWSRENLEEDNVDCKYCSSHSLNKAPAETSDIVFDEDMDEVTDAEIHQIEIFFCGLQTDLFICPSLANLYVASTDEAEKWFLKHTGIPLVLFDKGETKSRRKKKIQIILAERGTCFPLWKDTIDNLTAYQRVGEAFHTMYLSSDHSQIIGLSFNSSVESDHFYDHVIKLTSDPENINISVPGSKKRKKQSVRKAALISDKDQISNPCMFEHVTSVSAKDRPMYMSLQTVLNNELINQRKYIL